MINQGFDIAVLIIERATLISVSRMRHCVFYSISSLFLNRLSKIKIKSKMIEAKKEENNQSLLTIGTLNFQIKIIVLNDSYYFLLAMKIRFMIILGFSDLIKRVI